MADSVRTGRPDLKMPWIEELPERQAQVGPLSGFYKNTQKETVEYWVDNNLKSWIKAYAFMGFEGEAFFKDWKLLVRTQRTPWDQK